MAIKAIRRIGFFFFGSPSTTSSAAGASAVAIVFSPKGQIVIC